MGDALVASKWRKKILPNFAKKSTAHARPSDRARAREGGRTNQCLTSFPVYGTVSLQTQALHAGLCLNHWFANIDIYILEVYYSG
jgi:hypothetical protein